MASRSNHVADWEKRAARAQFRVTKLAKDCGMSERQPRRYFLKNFKQSLRKWPTATGLERVRALLMHPRRISIPVTLVAALLLNLSAVIGAEIGCSAKAGYLAYHQNICDFEGIQSAIRLVPDNESNIIQETIKESADLLKDTNQWADLSWVQSIQVCEDPSGGNAYADSVSGQIVLGYRLLHETYTYANNLTMAQTWGSSFGRDAVTAVFFHEFAHHYQFSVMQKWFPVYLPTGTNIVDVKKVELEADAISAAFLKARFGMDEKECEAVELVFASLGSSDFKNPAFHGYPYERRWAAKTVGMGSVEQDKPITESMLKEIHNKIFVDPLPPSILPGKLGNPASDAIRTVDILIKSAQQDLPTAETFEAYRISRSQNGLIPNTYSNIFYGGGIATSNDAQSVYASLREVQAAEDLWTNQAYFGPTNSSTGRTENAEYGRKMLVAHLKEARNALKELELSYNRRNNATTVLNPAKQLDAFYSSKQKKPTVILSPRTIDVRPDQTPAILPIESELQLSTGRIKGSELECFVSSVAPNVNATNTIGSAFLSSGSTTEFRWKWHDYVLHLNRFSPEDHTATLSVAEY